jgi:GNAT superfamily N-acetyltransferase
MNNAKLIIRQMRREELNTLVKWAADEGWNPGLSDAGIFWATDPESFIAAELSGQLIGGGSIASYAGQYGFMGFFIIHPDHRGQRLGQQLWYERLHRLIARLEKPVSIGMDGVFDMQAFYTKGGFEFAVRDLRFEGRGKTYPMVDSVVELADIPFEMLDRYDRQHFPAARQDFLRLWIKQPGVIAKAVMQNQQLSGYAVMRPCQTGFKIGPLFAADATCADQLFRALVTHIPDQPVFIDVPENNPAAMALTRQYEMTEVFGCAKMYYGRKPDLPENEIFAVTTFEFG